MPVHLLRYDDYSATSCLEVERLLVDTLRKTTYPCTFAVVPFALDTSEFVGSGRVSLRPLSGEKVSLIRELVDCGVIEVALHGWSHIATSPLRDHAEFADSMPVETQRRLIREGRDCLENAFQRKVTLFVPPWNRLGITTVQALLEEGIACVSAGYPSHWEGASPLGLRGAERLRSLPCWRSLGETEMSLRLASRLGDSETVVGTLLHDYDFLESPYSVAAWRVGDLEHLLTRLKKSAGTKPEAVGKATAEAPDAGWRRMELHTWTSRRFNRGFVARRIWGRYLRAAYWSVSTLRRFGSLSALIDPLGSVRSREEQGNERQVFN